VGVLCYWLQLRRIDLKQAEGEGLGRGCGGNQCEAVSLVEGGGHLVECTGGQVAIPRPPDAHAPSAPAGLVCLHEPAIAGHINDEDGSEPALDPIWRSTLHRVLPGTEILYQGSAPAHDPDKDLVTTRGDHSARLPQ
jgi:hypothetical protein